jgi:hypothetical protein
VIVTGNEHLVRSDIPFQPAFSRATKSWQSALRVYDNDDPVALAYPFSTVS